MESVALHSKIWLKAYDKPALLLAKDIPNNMYLLLVGLEKEMWRMMLKEENGKPALEFVDKIPTLHPDGTTTSPRRLQETEEDQGGSSGQKETRQRSEEETETADDTHNEG